MGPYREPAEDVEADLDALEIAAFKALLARRGRRVGVGVLLTVLGAIAPAAALAGFWLRCEQTTPPPSPAGRASRCETHLVSPARGEPFPMTICR